MGERVLIQSERYDIKRFVKIMVIIGAILSVLMALIILIYESQGYGDYYDRNYEIYLNHIDKDNCAYNFEFSKKCSKCQMIIDNPSKTGFIIRRAFQIAFHHETIYLALIPVATLALISGIIYFLLRSYELIVTDKRIYGKVAWGKRVDLPLDSVSATANFTIIKGISVSTSSGRIWFLVIKNADEMYKIINSLLLERQEEKVVTTTTAPVNDEVDQLKKYKDLLDSGVITQEDFDAKKKQLLGH